MGVEFVGDLGNIYNKLVVRNLTGNITLADEKAGVSFLDDGNIVIDVNTGEYKIVTRGILAAGINGYSTSGTVSIK